MDVADANGTGFDYVGSLIYRRNGDELELESTDFGGGRIVVSEGSSGAVYTPNYFITDHLGSTRAVVNSEGEILGRNNYYPYGLEWEYASSQISDNHYLYNGKEKQIVGIPVGVNYMDYGARILDLRLGGWLSPDPMEQYHSGYVYCGNNPVNLIDPTGMWSITLTGEAAQAAFIALRDAMGDDDDPEKKKQEEEKRRELTKSKKKQFKKLIREMELRDDILMGKYGPIPEWYLMGVEPSDEERYEIWSNALSNATIGILPVAIFKGITWLTRGANVSRATSTIKIATADDLIVTTKAFNRTKHGYHGAISGIGSVDDVFNTITTGGKIINRTSQSVTITMPNGTTVTKYVSSGGHGSTIQINQNGKLYKIRIK